MKKVHKPEIDSQNTVRVEILDFNSYKNCSKKSIEHMYYVIKESYSNIQYLLSISQSLSNSIQNSKARINRYEIEIGKISIELSEFIKKSNNRKIVQSAFQQLQILIESSQILSNSVLSSYTSSQGIAQSAQQEADLSYKSALEIQEQVQVLLKININKNNNLQNLFSIAKDSINIAQNVQNIAQSIQNSSQMNHNISMEIQQTVNRIAAKTNSIF